MTLEGKRVLVVGGTSGIGAAVARLAASAGAALTTASRRAEPPAGAHAHLVLDIADEAQVGAQLGGAAPFDHLVITEIGRASCRERV